MNRITLTVALTFASLSTAAIAQSSEDQQACMNDAFRVCSATIPDRARTTACMVQHKAELSSACQMVMDKYSPANNTATAYASTAPVAASVRATSTRNVSMQPADAKPVRTAANTQRPGKPLNILMR
jgi:hypothetical protein